MKMIINARGIALDTTMQTSLFTKLDKTQWYFPYLTTGEMLNLIDKSDVLKKINRGESAEIIYRAIALKEAGAEKYSKDLDVQVADKPMNKSISETGVHSYEAKLEGNNFQVMDNGELMKVLPYAVDANSELTADITAQSAKNIYISICDGGLGGYILYGFCNNGTYYSVNMDSKVVTSIVPPPTENISGLFDVSKDDSKFAWRYSSGPDNMNLSVVVTDKDPSIAAKFFPIPAKYLQYGDVKFSPDGTKFAYAAALGNPENETGTVYSVDIATGKETEVTTAEGSYFEVTGWKDNDIVNYEKK